MYAVEFETKINNGMLEIPIEYKRIRESTDAKVIVMIKTQENKKEKTNQSIFDGFLSMSKKVDCLIDYKRDELHDR
jgi:hypothetical protein